MAHSLSEIKGHYHTMPNSMLDFLYSDEYMVLAQINKSSHQCLCQTSIPVSLRNLARDTRMGRRKVMVCIERLEKLNLLSSSVTINKNTEFRINWEEIFALSEFAKTTSSDGFRQITERCITSSKLTPFSKLDKNFLSQVQQKYPYIKTGIISAQCDDLIPVESDGTGIKSQDNAQMIPAEIEHNEQGGIKSTKSAEMIPPTQNSGIISTENADLIPLNNEQGGIKSTKSVEMIPLACNQSSHYVEKIGEKFVLNVILSNAERYLMDIVGQNAFEVRFSSNLGGIISTHSGIKSTHESAEMIPPTQNSGITVIPQIIYNKDKEDSRDSEAIPIEGGENKKADDENENDDEAFFPDGTMMENIFSFLSFSSFFFSVKAKRSLGKNIEEIFNVLPAIEENNSAEQETDKDKTSSSFKSSWKEVRDLSLDCYSQIDFHFIIENTEFNDSPEDKIIQEVWSDLNNHPEQEEDILDEDYASSNIIPVTEFNRILFNVWSELKEQDENFQLSEQDVRNIFGFDAVWKDDEWQYVISSSKIRKLRHEEEEQPSRRNRKVRRSNRHGWEERMKIQEYLDCLYEIGKKNFQRLTKAEKAIYEINQYAHKDEWVADSGYVHQPHKELNTFQLENVMKDWENKSGMNEDELNDLLDGFKWRGARKTLILSPRQLSVDFIQSFNKDMGEESEVEEIWEEKMAVQG